MDDYSCQSDNAQKIVKIRLLSVNDKPATTPKIPKEAANNTMLLFLFELNCIRSNKMMLKKEIERGATAAPFAWALAPRGGKGVWGWGDFLVRLN
ncbi:hypothetical protein [Cyclobacterium xiamenense]|uniref:hypothetical protein n=1 Tax=Cyclobacterium xiamenense TaxID=1297121 RepID=UPI00115F7B66|nr:hypothetical protein [Cyclobacterium xiamenense]